MINFAFHSKKESIPINRCKNCTHLHNLCKNNIFSRCLLKLRHRGHFLYQFLTKLIFASLNLKRSNWIRLNFFGIFVYSDLISVNMNIPLISCNQLKWLPIRVRSNTLILPLLILRRVSSWTTSLPQRTFRVSLRHIYIFNRPHRSSPSIYL